MAVGDILLARGVQRQIDKYGEGYPFEKITEILGKADLAFGNLENPLTRSCVKAEKKYSFQAKPEYTRILRAAGFDILSLANNHSLDCGERGLIETINNLEREDLRWLGAGRTKAETDGPVLIEINDIKIAFLGFTALAPRKHLGRSRHIAFATDEDVTRAITAARKTADVIIVSFHWGTEYADSPNAEQIRLADASVKAGADVILGHHPHVLQGFQLMDRPDGKRKAIIAYSLGNFLFDSPVRLNRRVGESVILKIRLDNNGLVAAEALTVVVQNYRPVVANDKERETILTRLNRLSGDYNTSVLDGRIMSETIDVAKDVK